jgi:hypothetical protein
MLRLTAAEVVPGVYERDVVLVPKEPYEVTVGIGQAKFLNFNCMGGPADVIISLSTYSERADPLLFLSLDPDAPPSFQQHDASSFGQWREDEGGDHYVVAKSVSPKGGILGLVNMKHFAGEELRGILGIRCSFIIAFDTLFWEHLQSDAVCPVGGHFSKGQLIQSDEPCSGHGQCGTEGDCVCNGGWTGPACEHSQKDFVVTAEGRYKFKVANGRYQYFRVKVPSHFRGGFLEVSVTSEAPVVLLVRGNGLPTKSNFELSNFDDWVNQQNTTTLRYKVAAADELVGPAYATGGPFAQRPGVLGGAAQGRRLGVEVGSWGELFRRVQSAQAAEGAADTEDVSPSAFAGDGFQVGEEAYYTFEGEDSWAPAGSWPEVSPDEWVEEEAARRLFASEAFSVDEDDESIVDVDLSSAEAEGDTDAQSWQPARRLRDTDCQKVPMMTGPQCSSPSFRQCQEACMSCIPCVENRGQGPGHDAGCTGVCNTCVHPSCIKTMASCAQNVSCGGPEGEQCEKNCHRCMACFESNNEECGDCECCLGCLPLAAKCSKNPRQDWWASRSRQEQISRRYVFVGVFNHRRYYLDKSVIHATATIKLTVDPNFDREELPTSWIADLYNRFHDVRSLAITQQQIYPHGQQFVYEFPVNATGTMKMKVNVFRDRMTLLHLRNIGRVQNMVLDFKGGPNLTDVLTSSRAAPKTFFDFDRVHFTVGNHRMSTPMDSHGQAVGESSMRLGGHLSEIVDRSRHIEIFGSYEPAIWCAVFGAADGVLEVEARAYAGDLSASSGANSYASSPDAGHILLIFVVCGVVALACTYYRAQKLAERQGDEGVPLSERFANLLNRHHTEHESTQSLTRIGSLQGYIGSDEIDQSVEDQYLHRGGIGDDGI